QDSRLAPFLVILYLLTFSLYAQPSRSRIFTFAQDFPLVAGFCLVLGLLISLGALELFIN
ncbi:MAG: hypothetical protein VYA10_10180, partial [Verrucomicrobiota bacterium]|nr:hypothetical protein [Verrucomicrobiota bacterium]